MPEELPVVVVQNLIAEAEARALTTVDGSGSGSGSGSGEVDIGISFALDRHWWALCSRCPHVPRLHRPNVTLSGPYLQDVLASVAFTLSKLSAALLVSFPVDVLERLNQDRMNDKGETENGGVGFGRGSKNA